MATARGNLEVALSNFKSSGIMTMDQLSRELGISVRNTRRHLRKWGVYTSYNHNGRYYAHPSVARFNRHGVWSRDGVHFSKHGNLRDTFVALIESSESGMSADEAGRILLLNPRSFVSHFRSDPRLSREKLDGRYIYFSSKKCVCDRQKNSRPLSGRMSLISDQTAIFLLIEKIKSPSADPSKLAAILRGNGYEVNSVAVESFLENHGLLKKT